MIKAICFDCDGVLIESAQIKTEAFKKLFSKWPCHVDEIVSYHMVNMGISRYVKFKHFFENILQQPYTDEIGEDLGREFSGLVKDEIMRAPVVAGTIDFLKTFRQRYRYFIASGTPENELLEIVAAKGLHDYFDGIFGSPTGKTEIVNNILKANSYESSQVVFVGDALSDKRAAMDTHVHFILRLTGENDDLSRGERYVIRDLTQLKEKLEDIAR